MTELGIGVITEEDERRYDALPPALRNRIKDPALARYFWLKGIAELARRELDTLEERERAGYDDEVIEGLDNISHRYYSDRLRWVDVAMRRMRK